MAIFVDNLWKMMCCVRQLHDRKEYFKAFVDDISGGLKRGSSSGELKPIYKSVFCSPVTPLLTCCLCPHIFAKLEQRWWDADMVCMTHLPPEQDVWNWICDVLNCHSLEELVSTAIFECVITRFSQAQETTVQCGHLFADLQCLPANQA